MFFCRKLGEDQKKRSSSKTEVCLLLNHCSRGIWCYIRPYFVGLFPLINQRSNLDGGTPKSQWGGRLNLVGGTVKLDGRTRPPRPPYNLSTEYTHSTYPPQCTVQTIVTERKIDYRQMPPEKNIRIRLVSSTSRLCSKRRLRVSKLSKRELS